MNAGTRCPTCNHSQSIHYRDGTCPRWANARLDSALRVIVRIGDRWPGCEGHLLAFFVDTADRGSGMIAAWDLTDGNSFDAPILTLDSNKGRWTKKPSAEQVADAKDELRLTCGERVSVVRQLFI